uniref:Uncharacterized protein n=1 Tax=Meloidogyne enterolobii TaxID=390850 RepID=A0A6V7VGI7_MELEN|nr:unnamed protein product [Meloidogyne enterolobii]
MKLNRISIVNIDLDLLEGSHSYKFIIPGSGIFRFTLNNQLKKKYITTSKDCSKIVPIIIFDRILFRNFELNERAEKVEIKQSDYVKYTTFQISNIYNPKIKFAFYKEELDGGATSYIKIRKLKE